MELPASTGPRPRGRGMRRPFVLTLKPKSASTGPRPRGRGMQIPDHPAKARHHCFNGAAPARARNVAQVTDAAIALDASTGPRPRGRGMNRRRCRRRRQKEASTGPRPRGRGMCKPAASSALPPRSFNGAAPARARNGRLDGCELGLQRAASTGPRPRGRGMVPKPPQLNLDIKLQRGRARAGAEWIAPWTSPSSIQMLQRGRARAGAEWIIGRSQEPPPSPASTGPRPRGRGMVTLGDPLGPEPFRLQRGRARAGAECLPARPPWPQRPRFNGAAPARARNGEPRLLLPHLGWHASTGPRPRGRGMLLFTLLDVNSTRLLQRGRARAGAEWFSLGPHRWSSGRSFNGAAPARARNVT